jgi:hypothetical protein
MTAPELAISSHASRVVCAGRRDRLVGVLHGSSDDGRCGRRRRVGVRADDDGRIDELCLPVGDGEWTGPIAAQFVPPNSPQSDCPPAWAAGPTGFVDLDIPPFDCACSCPRQPEVTCAFHYEFNTGNTCDGDTVVVDFGGLGECASHGVPGASSVLVSDISTEADCGGGVFAEAVPPTWTERIDACVPPLGETCSLGACVPRPPMMFDGPLCITREGEHDCPEGPFDIRRVAYAGYADERMCQCDCAATEVSCAGIAVASGTEGCGNEVGSNNVDVCIASLDDIHSASVSSVTGSAQCVALGDPTPQGEVTRNGPRTFCCAAP